MADNISHYCLILEADEDKCPPAISYSRKYGSNERENEGDDTFRVRSRFRGNADRGPLTAITDPIAFQAEFHGKKR